MAVRPFSLSFLVQGPRLLSNGFVMTVGEQVPRALSPGLAQEMSIICLGPFLGAVMSPVEVTPVRGS